MQNMMQDTRRRYCKAAMMTMASVMTGIADVDMVNLTMNVVSDALRLHIMQEPQEESNHRRRRTIVGIWWWSQTLRSKSLGVEPNCRRAGLQVVGLISTRNHVGVIKQHKD